LRPLVLGEQGPPKATRKVAAGHRHGPFTHVLPEAIVPGVLSLPLGSCKR
jgi:hypothetical protein